MKLHRFYVRTTGLAQELTITDSSLVKQWTRVLRFAPGRAVVLFNDQRVEAHYIITEITRSKVTLSKQSEHRTEPIGPVNYLCFALLKKDKVDWVLQKGTELGIDVFVPLITERTEKKGFDVERAHKIVIEAVEQSGRVSIPELREPSDVQSVLERMRSESVHVAVAEQQLSPAKTFPLKGQSRALIVGPEGGWAETEKLFFSDQGVEYISLSPHTLRAETACVIAAHWLQTSVPIE